MDCSLPGSSIHGIFQARIEWVAISFCRGSSQPRDRNGSPALQADSLLSEPQGKLSCSYQKVKNLQLVDWVIKESRTVILSSLEEGYEGWKFASQGMFGCILRHCWLPKLWRGVWGVSCYCHVLSRSPEYGHISYNRKTVPILKWLVI